MELVRETWDLLRSYIDTHDRSSAADELINMLVDNNFDAAEIKETFSGDKDIMNALKYFTELYDSDEETDDDMDSADDWQ